MGKTSEAKTPPGEFKVTTLENSLLSKQTVTSVGKIHVCIAYKAHAAEN